MNSPILTTASVHAMAAASGKSDRLRPIVDDAAGKIARLAGPGLLIAGMMAMLCWATSPAAAQVSPGFTNSRIVIYEHDKGDGGYWMTSSGNPDATDASKKGPQPLMADSVAIRNSMKQRRVLEEYAELISPLRFPRTLRLFASDCTGSKLDSPYYDSDPFDHWMNICYSFIADAQKNANVLAQKQADLKLWTPVSATQLTAGMFAAVIMHETGHAMFDLMDIPVFGREEDGADQVAAFVALQFGKDNARTVIKGFAYFWAFEAKLDKADPGAYTIDPKNPKYPTDPDQRCFVDAFCAYSDMHGTASQRMYNTLCLAYGGHPDWFQDFVDSGWLPASRVPNCPREYNQALNAFKKTVYPFIDQAQMDKVLARKDWFQPAELKEK